MHKLHAKFMSNLGQFSAIDREGPLSRMSENSRHQYDLLNEHLCHGTELENRCLHRIDERGGEIDIRAVLILG